MTGEAVGGMALPARQIVAFVLHLVFVTDHAITLGRNPHHVFVGAVALVAFHRCDAVTTVIPLVHDLGGLFTVAVAARDVHFLLIHVGVIRGYAFSG